MNGNEQEIENLKYSYDRALDIFKLHNDNYFKRVQIIMVALQAGLFIVLMKHLRPIPVLPKELIVPIFVTVLGLVISFTWYTLMKRQMQYIELLKRYIRNIEWRFAELAIPTDYFSIEAAIMKPIIANTKEEMKRMKEKIKEGKEIKEDKGKNRYVVLKWSGERYPGEKNADEPDNNLTVGEVKGGLQRIERRLSVGIICLWSILFVSLIVWLSC